MCYCKVKQSTTVRLKVKTYILWHSEQRCYSLLMYCNLRELAHSIIDFEWHWNISS